MVRLSAELILKSPAFINPVKDRELDVRGNKIPAIENLGVTQDQFDTLDLSDNAIRRLEGFPYLPRLKHLLISNNRVSKIVTGVNEALPNLETLILSNNRMTSLASLEPLAQFPNLKSLSLMSNPVLDKEHYRLYVVYHIPQIKILDFRKVKEKERAAAKKLFGGSAGKKLRQSIQQAGQEANGEEEDGHDEQTANSSNGLSEADVEKIKTAIANAKNLEEVSRLENALRNGILPENLEGAEDKDVEMEG